MVRRSISARLFVSSVIVFLILLFVQWYLIRRSFNDLYLESMIAAFQNELHESALDFTGGTELTSSQGLRKLSADTGAPVLAFNDSYEITDREFFANFMNVSINSPSYGVVKVITDSMVNSENLPYFNRGRILGIDAVPVGSSSFHEPITITLNAARYINKDAVRRYGSQDELPRVITQGNVTRMQYTSPKNLQQEVARYIYDNVKDLLIFKLDIEPYLQELCRGSRQDERGDTYQFLYEKKAVAGQELYFLTARRVYFTGHEQTYINAFFYRIYGILGFVLILSAFVLSRYISKPLVKLNGAASRLASLDFSTRIESRRTDEFGQLANNINVLSDNLSQALEKLKNAEAEALRREKRMQVLLTDLGHELRTPLGVISANTEIFEKGLYGANPADYFNLLYSEIDNLSSMVDEAIDLARMESGNWRIEITQWELSDVILPSVKRLSGKLRESGFTITYRLIEANVMADARRIDQVMTNLLNNALKYSDDQRRIEIVAQMEGTDQVRILVGNSGYLSDEEKDRIWERYYRKLQSRPPLVPSEGIGLDFIRTILAAHGSKYGVKVESGMVWFYFTLPGVPPVDDDEPGRRE